MAASKRKRESKQIFDDIKVKTKEIIQNRKKVNHIIDFQTHLENEESTVVIAAVKALDKIFCHFIQNGSLSSNGPGSEVESEKKVREWLMQRYNEFQEFLLSMISARQISIQEQSLVTLMHMLQIEGQHPINNDERKEYSFPSKLLENLVTKMLELKTETIPVLTRFQEFMEYEDVLYHLLRVLGIILKSKTDADEKFLKNLISVLEHVTLSSTMGTTDEKRKLFCSGKKEFKWNYGQAKKFFSQVWTYVLKSPLNASLYKRVLVILPDKVLPHLEKPLLLTDFLMTSYAIGGAVSILALHGVFLLMQNHNLEYPEFYTKLYSLLEPSVLFVKYRARFFFLLDLFMTSTHVPEYIAAAYVKRLARLSLIAPPNVAVMLLHFIGNFMIRHRGLTRMAHNPQNQEDVTSDPFIMDEGNLVSCNAMDSSLWEIKTLQSHILPEIANAAKFIDRELPKTEWDITQDLELTVEDMLEKEMKRKNPGEVPLNFERPTKFACVKNEKLTEYFELA
nr:EOG090X04ZD [Sida crystallina]